MRCVTGLVAVCLLPCVALKAQALPATSLYLSPESMHYETLLSGPPKAGSAEQHRELAALHAAQASRTAAAIRQARADDAEESMFAYASVVGPGLQASTLPLVAALSAHLRHESAVINPPLKLLFGRPRPFVTDPTLEPVCERTATAAYPSGHAMVGYLEAFALAQMLPSQKDAILERARQFAASRIVCGVHYPSDVEASRTVALALFGALQTSERFQKELKAARSELMQVLERDQVPVR